MVLINKNLEIAKNNLNEVKDVIIASEDSKESMRRDLIKISEKFYIHFALEEKSDMIKMK